MDVLDLLHVEEIWDILQVCRIEGTSWERNQQEGEALRRNDLGEYIFNELKIFYSKEGTQLELKPHPTTHNKMGWPREIIIALWQKRGWCCKIKAYLTICGLRHDYIGGGFIVEKSHCVTL